MNKLAEKIKNDWENMTAAIIIFSVFQLADYFSTNHFIKEIRSERGLGASEYVLRQLCAKRLGELYSLPLHIGEVAAFYKYERDEHKKFLEYYHLKDD